MQYGILAPPLPIGKTSEVQRTFSLLNTRKIPVKVRQTLLESEHLSLPEEIGPHHTKLP